MWKGTKTPKHRWLSPILGYPTQVRWVAPYPVPHDWSGSPTRLRHKKRFCARWNCISVCNFSHRGKVAVTQEENAPDVSKTRSSVVQGVWTTVELLQKNCLYFQPKRFQVTVISTPPSMSLLPVDGVHLWYHVSSFASRIAGFGCTQPGLPMGLWDTSRCGGRTHLLPTGKCLSSSSLFPREVSSDQCFWVGKLTQVTSYAGFSGLGGTEQHAIHMLELRALQSTCSPFLYHRQDLHIHTERGQFNHRVGRSGPPCPPFSAREWLPRDASAQKAGFTP